MENPQKSLDITRTRISQLVQTLDAFRRSLLLKPPHELPPWEQLQSHFNVLSSALDSLTSTLHSHFPAHSTSALTSYPLPSFPAQANEILLTTLLTKKPPAETFDAIWSALQAPAVEASTEALWARAAEIVVELQESRDWGSAVVTAEEMEEGTVREEEWVLDSGETGGGDARKDMAVMLGVLRFCETGVPIAEQVPLPSGKLRTR